MNLFEVFVNNFLIFSGVVLQRASPDYPHSVYVPNSLKFTVAFNLAVVWMLIFVSLSKGSVVTYYVNYGAMLISKLRFCSLYY